MLIQPNTQDFAARTLALADTDIVPWQHRSLGTATVLTAPDTPVIALPDGHGAIIGRLFSPPPSATEIQSPPPTLISSLRRDGVVALATAAWGSYIAILSQGDRLDVARDPSGALPCLYGGGPDGLVVASDVRDLLRFAGIAPSIDYDYLATQLYHQDLRSEHTGLCGIKELLPGVCLQSRGMSRTHMPFWSPYPFMVRGHTTTFLDQAERLKVAIQSSVGALASGYDKFLLSLSGGLDSSVIAAALHDQGLKPRAVTFATRDSEGDERPYAREVAHHLSLELDEIIYDYKAVDIRQSVSKHLPRPIGYAFSQPNSSHKRQLAAVHGIKALIGGIGGDNVFGYSPSATPLVDRFRCQGLTPGLWHTLEDICQLTRASYGDVIAAAVRRHFRTDQGYQWPVSDRFLAPNFRPVPPKQWHPWLEAPEGTLPGKAVHVGLIVRAQLLLDGFEHQTLDQLNPLLAQPVMEVSLAIPSWFGCAGGLNRAPVRAAFAGALPDAIIKRRSKGGPRSLANEVLMAGRREASDILSRGYLAGNGVIDGGLVRAILEGRQPIAAADQLRCLSLLEAEAWAAHWS
ncbi:asparagine synthase-related protein [Asticcacaulis machinosus]|uniref:asparagine synthase (glutamine-hydrolyzing) n=1 Tax=Asticcacaulis machinosus TaxID=2984211 RepID=A0ABT5HH04_9CAUL|nr:asparagine synthetase B family protein [Asticcacaulis machinosus]MDC7675523.1 asparagine synthase-related protein [Asticcacaulis machinosus]